MPDIEITCKKCGDYFEPASVSSTGYVYDEMCPTCCNEDAACGDVSEDTNFDKFIDATLIREQKKKTLNEHVVSPQRRLARNYQEHPLGKVRIKKGVNNV